MVTRPVGNISGEATSQSGNIIHEAMRQVLPFERRILDVDTHAHPPTLS